MQENAGVMEKSGGKKKSKVRTERKEQGKTEG